MLSNQDFEELVLLSIEERTQVIDWIDAAKDRQSLFIPSKDAGSLLGKVD